VTFGIDGLVSGLDTTSLISQIMSVERAPQNQLVSRRSRTQSQLDAFRGLNTRFQALRSAAVALSSPAGWRLWSATSSDSSKVVAQASSAAVGGSLSFTVDSLATAHAVVSSGSVAGTGSFVAAGPVLLAKGAAPLGVQSVASGTGLALGAHTITVTQASAAATKVGTAVAPTTNITLGVNDTVAITVDGIATPLTIGPGAYTANQLAAAVETAAGGSLVVDVTGGALRLVTAREGSAASIQVTGGSALTDLGLTIDPSAITGLDGIVEVDGNANVVTDVFSGAAVAWSDGSGGTIDAVLAGGLRSGTVTATGVAVGDGSLASVVSAVNLANAGVIATAVKVGTNAYKLQLQSTTTGATSTLAVDPDAFGPLGTLSTLTAAADAELTVGSGPAAYSVTSSTNHVADLLPGVTLDLVTASPSTTVTVSVNRDAAAATAKVKGLVDAANAAVAEIKRLSAFDSAAEQGSLLTGDSTLRRLQSQLATAVTSAVSVSSFGSPGAVGVSINADGTFAFDATKFTAAYQADPAAVEGLFRRNGTATSSHVQLFSATAATLAGPYNVVVTQAAEQAAVAGNTVAGGTITLAETIELQVGTTTATYAASAGESLSSIASGINAQIAAAGLDLVAEVDVDHLVVRTVAYGSAATFSVQTSLVGAGQTGLATVAATWEAHSGVDVVGTIDGTTATGSGQILAAPIDDPTLGGLSLLVDATPADVALSTDFGTFTYVPGVAARIETVGRLAVDPSTGLLTMAVTSHETQIDTLTKRIEAYDTRLTLREQNLRRQFLALEIALARLQSQSTFLTNQLSQFSGSNGTGGRPR
jgi:flagellar hook-associated protein 2